MIATNCARLEIFLDGKHYLTAYPDTKDYPHLAFPPVVVDLTVSPAAHPDLRVEGYLSKTSKPGEKAATVLKMTAATSGDRLEMTAGDTSIVGDGSDATRITFRATNAYGNHRPGVGGAVTLPCPSRPVRPCRRSWWAAPRSTSPPTAVSAARSSVPCPGRPRARQ